MGAALTLNEKARSTMVFFHSGAISKEIVVEEILKYYTNHVLIDETPPTLGDIQGELYPELFIETLIFRAKGGEDLSYYGVSLDEIIQHEENGTIAKYSDSLREIIDQNLGYGIGHDLELEMVADIQTILDEKGLFYFDRVDTSDIVWHRNDQGVNLYPRNIPICEVW